jgi:hypothetical protein
MLSWGSLLRTARATVGVLLVTGLALILPGQTADMLAGLWEDSVWPSIAFHFALWFLAFSAWHWSRASLSARFQVPDRDADRHDERWLTSPSGEVADPAVLEWLPRVLFLAAAGLGIIAALRSNGWGHLVVILIWAGLSLALLIWRLSIQRYLFGSEDLTAASAPLTPAPNSLPRWLRGPWNSLRLLLRHAPAMRHRRRPPLNRRRHC